MKKEIVRRIGDWQYYSDGSIAHRHFTTRRMKQEIGCRWFWYLVKNNRCSKCGAVIPEGEL